MRVTQNDPAVVRLDDGNVLVAGGTDSEGRLGLSDAELYHPSTGNWTMTGSLLSARSQFVAVQLSDSDVLAVGAPDPRSAHNCTIAQGGACSKLTGAEMYTLSSGRWHIITAPYLDRSDQVGIVLHDGTLLVAGGTCLGSSHGSCDFALRLTETFDTSSGRWRTETPMIAERTTFAAVLLSDGSVLAVGGLGESQSQGYPSAVTLASAERFFPRASAHA
jgi:hypothetical protein